ncbi:MAG: GTP-binding protein [Aquificota bacterium]|nr:GTP-binding protein [Aquificota bacterium]
MIPAFIITGFLGSGKTTLLINAARTHFRGRRVAVIVNELGEIGVDGKVLENTYSRVTELPEGCICCTLHAEFKRSLREIRDLYDPEVILVETSGSSEPFPVMISLQSLGCSIEGVICVVDTKNFPTYKDNPTARYQIGGSNVVVLSKVDLTGEKRAEEVERQVRKVWEENRLRNLFTGEEVFREVRFYRSVYGKVPHEVFAGTYTLKDLKDMGEMHRDHLMSFSHKVIYPQEPVTHEEIYRILNSLPEGVVRVKGIVRMDGFAEPVLVNYTFGLVDIGQEVPGYRGRSFLVIIGAGDHTKISTDLP